MDADVIVIGSGFGGSVCAMRAAEAGLRTIVLERGRRMGNAGFDELAAGRSRFLHTADDPGLIEVHRLKGLVALGGCALGGGSQVYTAVTVPAPEEVFQRGWPAAVNAESMRPRYQRVSEMLSPAPCPRPPARTEALEEIGRRMEARATTLPLAMDWQASGQQGNHGRVESFRAMAIRLLRGGAGSPKRTLDRTYLARAETAGARLLCLHQAESISPVASGYRVWCRRLAGGEWQEGALAAPRVVLAAGTLNTLRLLLVCRDRTGTLPRLSAALGQRFFTNGDCGGLLAWMRPRLPADEGPPVTAWLDLWREDRLYLMETGVLARGRAWSFGVMGFDDNPGAIHLNGDGGMVHLRRPDGSGAFNARVMARLRELARAAGAVLLAPPGFVHGRWPVTVHPLGGAAMGNSPEGGVTDSRGEVFGYPGLYIADGSLLPVPTGGPPSMTIAALAEAVSESLVGRS
jgi:cholesterol oxidase